MNQAKNKLEKTRESTKAWLTRYRAYGLQLKRLLAEIEQWEQLTEQLHTDDCCTEAQKDLLNTAAEQINALRERLAMQAMKRAALREQIEQIIAQIPDENQRLLLSLRYIDGLTWEQVADQMYYSVRNAVRLHPAALDRIAFEKMSKKWEKI